MSEGHFKYNAEPGATVIRALGGVRALAARLGLSPEAVSQWGRPPEHGGRAIAQRHWVPLMLMAREMGLSKTINIRLIAQPKITMPNSSKVKGDRFEWQVVNDLKKERFDAHRVPLSGAVVGYPGDIKIKTFEREWLVQCKISGPRGGSKTRVVNLLREASFARIKMNDALYVGMTAEVFYDRLRNITPQLVNSPYLRTEGQVITKSIHGHDVLIFRQSGVKAWYALMRYRLFWGVENNDAADDGTW